MSRHSRGWTGTTVTKARAYWTHRIASAAERGKPLPCHQCMEPVLPGQPYDVDHVITRHDGGPVRDLRNTWPSHRDCNRRAGQRQTVAIVATKKARLWQWT